MPSLNTQTFAVLLQNWVAAVQSAAAGLVDFTIGSILRAMGEAQSQVVLWLQGLILQLLVTTRAATSSGADLDSFIADFCGSGPSADFSRFAAVGSRGQVTFARITTTLPGLAPIGTTVESADGSQAFQVTVDTTNAAYSAASGGYVLAPGVSALTVPSQALTQGAASNVVAGAISVITAALPGIDTVTNASAFAGGADAESDAALRTRFVGFLLSLASATVYSIEDAILNIQEGATCTLVENQTYSGATLFGYGYVVVDDGTGAPGSGFLAACQAAVNGVHGRGFTTRCDVFAVSPVTVPWALSLTVQTGYTKAAVAMAVLASVNAYMTALGQGNAMAWGRLYQLALDTPGVATVFSVTLNGGTTDVACTAQQRILPGAGTVTTP